MIAVTKNPIVFTPNANPRNTPVAESQNHHLIVKGVSVFERNLTQEKQAMIMKSIS